MRHREVAVEAQGNGADCVGMDHEEIDCQTATGTDDPMCVCTDLVPEVFFYDGKIVADMCLGGNTCPTVTVGTETFHILGNAADLNMERADDICA